MLNAHDPEWKPGLHFIVGTWLIYMVTSIFPKKMHVNSMCLSSTWKIHMGYNYNNAYLFHECTLGGWILNYCCFCCGYTVWQFNGMPFLSLVKNNINVISNNMKLTEMQNTHFSKPQECITFKVNFEMLILQTCICLWPLYSLCFFWMGREKS